MRSYATGFRWSKRAKLAASLVAQDAESDGEIARQCGVHKATLERWKQHPDFAAHVQALVTEFAAKLTAVGIADRQNRVDALNDRWRRMQAVIAARADDPAMQRAPGGQTGLLVRQVKLVTVYDTARRVDPDATDDDLAGLADDEPLWSAKRSVAVEEFAVDTGLLKELRAHEEQAAKELGQWTEKHDHTGSVLIREYGGFDPDAV